MRMQVTAGVAVLTAVALTATVCSLPAEPEAPPRAAKAERPAKGDKAGHTRAQLELVELDLARRYDIRLDDGGTVRVLERARILGEVGPPEGTEDTGTFLPFDGWLVLQAEDGRKTTVPIERIIALDEPVRRP